MRRAAKKGNRIKIGDDARREKKSTSGRTSDRKKTNMNGEKKKKRGTSISADQRRQASDLGEGGCTKTNGAKIAQRGRIFSKGSRA